MQWGFALSVEDVVWLLVSSANDIRPDLVDKESIAMMLTWAVSVAATVAAVSTAPDVSM